MEHLIRRCKHCQKEYTYCTYGNGPEYGTEEGCSMDYCAECQKAIDDALGKIPLKFCHEFVPINEPLLLPVFQEIKNNYAKHPSGLCWPMFTRMYCCGNYDNIDEYIHNGILYRVEWDDDKPEELHVSVDMEYDIENKRLTGKPWITEEKDRYSHGRNSGKALERTFKEIEKVKPVPMSEPMGNLFYMEPKCDFEWDITAPKSEKKPEKVHRLCSYTFSQRGVGIKIDAKRGYGTEHRKVVFDKGVKPEKLIDFIEYEYTVEGYDDENTIQYKNIHIK